MPIEKGYKSQIIAVTFMNKPDAARGKDASLVFLEEAGTFENLKAAYWATRPTMEDGAFTTGMMVIFGCVCEGTKVWTDDGRQINIEDLEVYDSILGYGGRGITKEPILQAKTVATKPCYRIETSGGLSIECSYDHPLLWSRNHLIKEKDGEIRKKVTFKRAEDIKPGDQLMVVRQIPVFGTEKMWEPRLVGLLVGDGSYRDKSTPELAVGDEDVYNYLIDKQYKIKTYKKANVEDHFFRRVSILSSIDNLKELGIYGQVNGHKHLPPDIHKYDQHSIAELLGGYFDADGNVYYNKKKGVVRIVLTSKHKHLLEEVKLQLYKFSVGCNIVKERRKFGYTPGDIYRLYISKTEDAIQFKKHIRFLCKHKQNALDLLDEKKNSRSVYNNCFFEKDLENGKGDFYVKNNRLDNLEAVFVKNVEYIGEKKVYNLTAGYTNTYITNGFISGNTGGDMEGGTLDFESMFYDPETYNLLAFDNIWDDGAMGTSCGFFFPVQQSLVGFMDKDGNSDIAAAEKFVDENREKIRKSAKDPTALTK